MLCLVLGCHFSFVGSDLSKSLFVVESFLLHLKLKGVSELSVLLNLPLVGEVLLVTDDLALGQNTDVIAVTSLLSARKGISKHVVVTLDIHLSSHNLSDSVVGLDHLVKGGFLAF